jgi:hypothetical protein
MAKSFSSRRIAALADWRHASAKESLFRGPRKIPPRSVQAHLSLHVELRE